MKRIFLLNLITLLGGLVQHVVKVSFFQSFNYKQRCTYYEQNKAYARYSDILKQFSISPNPVIYPTFNFKHKSGFPFSKKSITLAFCIKRFLLNVFKCHTSIK